MIEVHVPDTGDTAYCETPEDALCAAHTLGREARQGHRAWGYDPLIQFLVDGSVVRAVALYSLPVAA